MLSNSGDYCNYTIIVWEGSIKIKIWTESNLTLVFDQTGGGGGMDQTPQNQTHILKCPNDGPLEAVKGMCLSVESQPKLELTCSTLA